MRFFTELFKKSDKFICTAPFSQVYIYHDGRVFLCPDCYVASPAQIGNLNEQTFDEIWNSEKAVSIRNNALKGAYLLCHPRNCHEKTNFNAKTVPQKPYSYDLRQKKYPQMVCLGPDWECNASCIMCRPEISRLSDEQFKELCAKNEKLYIPILKDAKELTLSTTSDPFGSRVCRNLIKSAAEKYPKLRFNIMTNGILCDEYNLKELGIWGRINKIMFSVHASNPQTYEKVVKYGNFEKVAENLKLMSELRKNNEIGDLYLGFVVTSKNYEDIPEFCEFAKNNNAVALFWMCRDWGGNLDNSDEPLEVWKREHPKFKDLQRVLKSITLETEYSHFNPYLLYLRDADV